MKYRETSRGLAVDFRLWLPNSLHSRPAAKLAQAARAFASDISLITESGEADAKSMLDLLSLAPARGEPLTLIARGPDAPGALEALSAMLTCGKE